MRRALKEIASLATQQPIKQNLARPQLGERDKYWKT